MRPLLLLLPLALTAAGCASVREPAGPGAWTMQASATAGAAVVRTSGAREVLRIACRRNPADLFVTTTLLRGSGGAVRLQVGDQTFGLAEIGEHPGLAAQGPIPETLPSALTTGGGVSLSQDSRRIGPYPPLDPKTAAAFAIACRGPVG